MNTPRPTTAAEIRRLVLERNENELVDRLVGHLQSSGHSLPGVLNELTVPEREHLVDVLFRLVTAGTAVH